jgi:colicin import membrane protein
MKTQLLAIVALVLAGCGGAPRVPDKVLDAQTARLDPAAAAQLSTARQELEQSRANVARAGDAIAQARQEEKLAESDQEKAEVQVERAKKALEDAELRKEAADARRRYAGKLVEAREAAEDAAKARAEVADAKLEHSKVVAIQQGSAKAGEQFRLSEFTERLADSQRQAEDAARKARELEQDASARQRRWEELARNAPPAKE